MRRSSRGDQTEGMGGGIIPRCRCLGYSLGTVPPLPTPFIDYPPFVVVAGAVDGVRTKGSDDE